MTIAKIVVRVILIFLIIVFVLVIACIAILKFAPDGIMAYYIIDFIEAIQSKTY